MNDVKEAFHSTEAFFIFKLSYGINYTYNQHYPRCILSDPAIGEDDLYGFRKHTIAIR